jgi:ABC-2 type transport system ATP-binding protein
LSTPDGAVVVVRDLVKSYGRVEAVRGLSFAIPAGECFGLLGPNGAGKTTTVEILEGLLAPSGGEVEVLGRRWGRDDQEIRERLGVCLQQTVLSEKLQVGETLALFRAFYREGREPQQVIEEVGLQEKARARVGTLSGGQKQRLAVACALAGDPDILFLDEPTTGLDPQSRRQMWELLRAQKEARRTILISTHYMEEAERLCDRVAVVDHGKVIALGTPPELIARTGGGDVVEVELDQPIELAPLRAAPSVTSAEAAAASEGAAYVMHVGEPHLAVPALLDLIAAAGRTLVHLSTRRATLEDVFVSLTGRHLRD